MRTSPKKKKSIYSISNNLIYSGINFQGFEGIVHTSRLIRLVVKSEWRRKVRRYLDVSRKSREPVTVPCLRAPPEDLRCNEYQELVLSFRVTRALSLSSSDDLVCRFCSLIIEQIRNEIERKRDTFRDSRERDS